MSGLPLVLLPGTLCDERLWARVLSFMPDIGEVVTPRYGKGSSMTEVVASLRKELPARFALAGFSLGGLAALELVRQAPESVDRLALICSHAQADTPAGSQARQDQLELARSRGLEALVSEQFVPAGLRASHPGYSESERLIRQMAIDTGLQGFERQTLMAITRRDQHDVLAAFSRPTLLLASAGDALCLPEKPTSADAASPTSRLVWVEGASHYLPLEQPESVAEGLLRWLRQTE
ncbi:MAG: alpha/beta hydrolase [Halomonas sp.]|nr:alpha/beta hydrolase [Halomonas sp.]|tara:strand:- start:4986 stop:5693 length:708 start_codon:yes stop_codon:yes gene_type:complete